MNSPEDPALESLLEYLKQSRGFDFTAYKRSSLARRIDKRLQVHGLEHYSEYLDFLEVHPTEFNHLFNTILINVTSFFRDPPYWEYLATEVLPSILAAKPPADPMRVWSAGCSSGEEAYTAAMILAEAVGVDQFRERVKVYATDVDEEALKTARQASYGPKDVEVIPPLLVEKYFSREKSLFVFDKDLRRSVIFGRHDLVQDAPISRVDLLICRNVLMYFNAESQGRILARFHFALNDGGVLFLGRAETLSPHGNTFEPTDLARRIFRKAPKSSLVERAQLFDQATSAPNAALPARDLVIFLSALETSQTAQIILDLNETLVYTNERARTTFGLGPQSIGSSFQDLSFALPANLRAAVEETIRERRIIDLKDVRWVSPSDQKELYFSVRVRPLVGSGGRLVGVGISFVDVTSFRREEELRATKQEVETAYEELQSTNEELETTNEELQSTVEELQTTNEELQSTNEELQTMNEEMQSTNEELHTVNQQLRVRTDELNESNAFLHTVLSSMGNALVVVDRSMNVLTWNPKSEDMWGLRATEVLGENFLNLGIGLPVDQLRGPIRTCLERKTAPVITVRAINRRGRAFPCTVECVPLVVQGKDVRGVIIMLHEAEEESPFEAGSPSGG